MKKAQNNNVRKQKNSLITKERWKDPIYRQKVTMSLKSKYANDIAFYDKFKASNIGDL